MRNEPQPNLQFKGARVVQCTIDTDSGVISEVTPRGIPQFIEVGLKDGNVLQIYADGTHSDMDEFRFVEYQARCNYPARKWLFEQFLSDHFPLLWQFYRFTRWQDRLRRQVFTWYLNKTESDPNRFYGWTLPPKQMRRYPFFRLPAWRRVDARET